MAGCAIPFMYLVDVVKLSMHRERVRKGRKVGPYSKFSGKNLFPTALKRLLLTIRCGNFHLTPLFRVRPLPHILLLTHKHIHLNVGGDDSIYGELREGAQKILPTH